MSIELLRDYARAAFPFVYLTTHEEHRALLEIQDWCGKSHRRFVTWSTEEGWSFEKEHADRQRANASRRNNSPDGFGSTYGQPQDPRAGLTIDPLTAIRMIPSMTKSMDQTGIVITLLDFHLFLQENSDGIAELIRVIKSVSGFCKSNGFFVVLLSCRACIPPELEKEIAVLEYDLPSAEYLGEVLDKVTGIARVPTVKDDMPQIIEAAKGMTAQEFEDALSLAACKYRKIDKAVIPCISDLKASAIKKGGLLEYYPHGTGDQMIHVGGLDLLKAWLTSRKRVFAELKAAAEFGLPTPRGTLIIGVAGSGKSLIAKAVANCWSMPLVRFDPGKAFGSLVGQSEERIRSVCKQAAALAPAILWVDEIEKGMSGLGSSGYTDSGVTARVFGTFLTWMQENTAPVFIVATANSIASLPPELIRRFSEIWSVDLPTNEEREEIWKIHITKPRLGHPGRKVEDFDLPQLVERSVGLSGAEIEKAYLDGLMRAFEAGREVTTEDVVEGCMSITPISRSMAEQIAATRQWCHDHARPASSVVEKLKEEQPLGFKPPDRKLDTGEEKS